MMWLRAVCLGLLVIGTTLADSDSYENNPFLHGFANDVNAFIQDQARLAAVDSGAEENPGHSVANRAIDGYAAPTYLPPVERKLICSGNQVCVSKYNCRGGYFTADLQFAKQECIPDTEVCCTYRPPPPPATPCNGRFEACVSPQQCIQGVWQANGRAQPPYASKCYAPEVCCRIPDPETTALTDNGYVVHVPQIQLITPTIRPVPIITTTRAPIYLPPDRVAQPTIIKGESYLSLPINPPPKNTIEEAVHTLPVTCAAALNCTAIEYCTATGVISRTPISLTPDQQAYRVPLTDCQDPVKGIIGKCCRDPDYVDPWPISQLGQYTDAKLFGDDGQYRPAASVLRPQIVPKPAGPIREFNPNPAPIARPVQTPDVPVYTAELGPAIYPAPTTCGVRNPNASPSGSGPFDASFSEYPWQLMVLREATKTILCGGVILAEDLAMTAASCVQGLSPYDIIVKAGEWKLGRDEEPLNFQLVHTRKIEIHPTNGMALLFLESKLKFAQHIAPICLDANEPSPSDSCVTTGWGKQAISLHLQDAVMHHSPVSIVSAEQCQAAGSGYQYGPGILCGRPQIDGCDLDPGSALACLNRQGQYVLKGIHLSSSSCGSGNPTISFGRPDLAWIAGDAPAGNAVPAFTNEYLPPRH